METLVIAWQGQNDQIHVMLWPDGTPQILTSFVTNFAPATATCGGTTYLAWRDKSSGCLAWAVSTDGVTFSLQITSTPDSMTTGPSLSVFNNQVYAAYGNNGQLAVTNLQFTTYGHQPIYLDSNSSKQSPALGTLTDAAGSETLYVAWQNSNSNIYCCTSTDGATFSTYFQVGVSAVAQTGFSPALACFGNDMYLAWTGRDGDNTPNLLNITVSGSTKVKLSGESSFAAPSLSTYVSPFKGDPTLYYGWWGKNSVINFLSSTDGKSFRSKVELTGETTALAFAFAPAPYFPVHTVPNDQTLVSELATWVEDSWGDYSKNAQVLMVTFTVSPSAAAVSASLYLYNANASDRFMIGSVQKVFTGTLLAARQAAASGQATYQDDDFAAPYLNFTDPAPTGNIAVIKLSDLATMTSRMERQLEKPALSTPYNGDGPPTPIDYELWNAESSYYDTKVGNVSKYSNSGYVTLAFAVSQPDSYNYNYSLLRLLAGPFGLTRIDTNVSTICVQGYAENGYTTAPDIQNASGIRTTPTDLANFFGKFLSYAATSKLFPAFANSEQAQLATAALNCPNPHNSNWSLGCWERDIASQTLTTFDKNGVSGQGGFGAWVRLAQSAPSPFPTAGVLVVQNRAKGPTEFSQRVLDYLLGDTTSKWPTKSVESQEPVEDSDPVA